MSTLLKSVRAAGGLPPFFPASEASRFLGRPTSAILRAVRTLDLKCSRAGNAKSAAILLTRDDLEAIDIFLNNER